MSQSTVRSHDPADALATLVERIDLLDRLASQALTRVAERARATPADVDGTAAELLYVAAIGADLCACREVASALMASGLTVERICDVHIPDAVRRMGEEWVGGDLPFSTVTIGTARLQGLLRELDRDFASHPERATGMAGAILLVISPGADHTLGPLVLTSQLRRKGFSVRLSLGESSEAVAETVATGRFDAVFLSATTHMSLPHLTRTAVAIRAATTTPPPVVLGGALVARGALAGGGTNDMIDEVADETDLAAVDHVTNDLEEAMRLCGLGIAR